MIDHIDIPIPDLRCLKWAIHKIPKFLTTVIVKR